MVHAVEDWEREREKEGDGVVEWEEVEAGVGVDVVEEEGEPPNRVILRMWSTHDAREGVGAAETELTLLVGIGERVGVGEVEEERSPTPS